MASATPLAGAAPLTVDFSISGLAGDAATAWTFDDGSPVLALDAGVATVSHTYVAVGVHVVTVAATVNGDAVPGPEPVTITVLPGPAAGLAADRALAAAGTSITFSDRSTGTVESLAWDFGDGTNATGPGPASHAFASAGTYSVTLTVTTGSASSSASVTVRVLAAWGGALNLYRSAAWVRQYTTTWCVAASSQAMRNISLRISDRSVALQRSMISYARAHDSLSASAAGSDPTGWAAALRRYGAGASYTARRFSTMRSAIEYAARRIRLTGKPVGLPVLNGGHAWTMTGFTASADPAFTTGAVVTGVYVSGTGMASLYWSGGTTRDPLNRYLRLASLAPYYGRYWQRDGWLGWYGRWVIVAP